jgi:hypothetical protein
MFDKLRRANMEKCQTLTVTNPNMIMSSPWILRLPRSEVTRFLAPVSGHHPGHWADCCCEDAKNVCIFGWWEIWNCWSNRCQQFEAAWPTLRQIWHTGLVFPPKPLLKELWAAGQPRPRPLPLERPPDRRTTSGPVGWTRSPNLRSRMALCHIGSGDANFRSCSL